MSNICPLCEHYSTIFKEIENRIFHRCCHCFGVFLDKKSRLNIEEEKLRYQLHNNDVEDSRYQKFVEPITSRILRDFKPESIGLDFGAGTGPVISKVLQDQNFNIKSYDPFFHNYPELLEDKYDYIACCEVIEHFYHPKKEFGLLNKLVSPSGKLYCMTEMVNDQINFESWYYKNDPTHVFFYHKKSMEWIKKIVGFSQVSFHGRLTIFYN